MKKSRFKVKPWRSAAYLKRVRGESCLSCGSPFDVQAHHLRHAERRGMGRKASDIWAVPLCVTCHMNCHTLGRESDWWSAHTRIDPIDWATEFYDRYSKEKSHE